MKDKYIYHEELKKYSEKLATRKQIIVANKADSMQDETNYKALVKLAKENCSDIFVSIHLNSIPDIEMNVHKNRGTSVYYYNQHSK